MYVYHNIENESVLNVEQIFARQSVIRQLKTRFTTYGYREITTSVFEQYDLYSKMNGTVNHHEMIKTIDNTGQVLVLRPDITIPLTQQLAASETTLEKDIRYFYVLDVYRQIQETKQYRESTQAGVEYFGNPSIEADAEIIALAIHLLQDTQVKNFKIELGHAGFFKQVVQDMNVSKEDFQELQKLIQAKNIPEMEQLLQRLALPNAMSEVIISLPFLYGNLEDVLQKAAALPLTDHLKETLEDIQAIYNVLSAYQVAEHVVIDLSLINHMDYYSDIVFQGFIEKVGKPVLMGGRYDALAKQFDADFPAIGFACDLDLLLSGMEEEHLASITPVKLTLIYEKDEEKRAIALAQDLRNAGYSIFTYPSNGNKTNIPASSCTIHVSAKENRFSHAGKETVFTTNNTLFALLEKIKEGK